MKRSFFFIATVSLTAGLSIGCCAQERATADTSLMRAEPSVDYVDTGYPAKRATPEGHITLVLGRRPPAVQGMLQAPLPGPKPPAAKYTFGRKGHRKVCRSDSVVFPTPTTP